MQTIDVRFQATSNFGAVQSQLAALTKQAGALQSAFAAGAFAKTPAMIDPDAWNAGSKAVSAASSTFRNALAQSQMFTTQQIVARKESERFTEQIKKQNLSFSEMNKNRGIMNEVWRDQAKFQRMTAQYWGEDTRGRAVTDIAVPKNTPTDLKNVNMQLARQGYELQSGGKQWVNWGKNVQWAGRQLTVGFSYPMALVAGAAGIMAYKVDQSITKIAKVYDYEADSAMNGANAVQQSGILRDQAMQTGTEAASKYGKSITDTMDVMQNFAASGFSGKQLDDITQLTQKISVLGDLTKETSFPLVQSLWSAFGGAGKQLKNVDDLRSVLSYLNKTANDTNLQLEDMAESIPRAATAMGGMGVSVEQMTTMLVAMREVGIDAAEGANALKSGTAAIINPTNAIVESVKSLSGGMVDLKGMAQDTGGNMYEFMKLLHEQFKQVKGEGADLAKAQILERIFGRYQFNRASAIMENLGAAWDGTANQTSKAMNNMDLSAQELAKSTDKSMDKINQSVSMKLKKAFSGVQIQLAELGESMLPIATTFLQVIDSIIGGINSLPGPVKIIIGIIATIAAMAGPIGMLTGLIGNLFGTFASLAGKAMAWASGHKFVTKEQQAATLAAQAQNEAMSTQGQSANTLGKELSFLQEAYRRATDQAKYFMEFVSGGQGATAAATKQIGQQIQGVNNLGNAYQENARKMQQAQVQTQQAVQKTTESYAQQLAAARTAATQTTVTTRTRGGEAKPVSTGPLVYSTAPAGPGLAQQMAMAEKATAAAQRQAMAEKEITASIAAATRQAEAHANAQQRISAAMGQTGRRAQQQYQAIKELPIATAQAAQNQSKLNGMLQAGGVYGGIFSASMAASMISSNEIVNSFAKWMMMGAIVAPMLQGVSSFFKEAAANRAAGAAAAAAETTAVSATTAAQAKLTAMKAEQGAIERAIFIATVQRIEAVNLEGAGTARVAALEAEILALKNAQTVATGRLAAAEAGVTVAKAEQAAASEAAAVSTNALMGPIGWTVLAITAAVGGFMAWKKHADAAVQKQKELIAKQVESQQALANSAKEFGEHIGNAVKEYQRFQGVVVAQKIVGGSDLMKSYDFYKNEDAGKAAVKGLNPNDMNQLGRQFIEFQRLSGMTAKQAEEALAGMLMAIGEGASYALSKAKEVRKEYDLSDLLDTQLNILEKSTDDFVKRGDKGGGLLSKWLHLGWGEYEADPNQVTLLKQEAKKSSVIFQDALAQASSPEEAKDIINKFLKAAMTQWNAQFSNIMKSDDSDMNVLKSTFKKYGVASGAEFADAWRNNKDFHKAIKEMMDDPKNRDAATALSKLIAGGGTYEETIIGQMSKDMPELNDKINNATDAEKEFNKNSIGQTLSEAQNSAKDLNKEFMFGRISSQEFSDQIRLIAKAQGIKEGVNAMDTFNNVLNNVKDEASGAGGKVAELKNKIGALQSKNIHISIKSDQMGGIYQDAMSGVKDQMVDQMTSAFEARQESETRALEQQQDAATRGLDARQEAAMNGLDARQEGAMNRLEARQEGAEKRFEAGLEKRKKAVENYYKVRIDAIESAVKAEENAQKRLNDLFEAEKQRLQDQADAEIRNIDYRKAVASGDMDEAARIAANAGAQDITSQLDEQQKAAQTASEARIANLEAKRDALEKKSDAAIERLEKKMDALRDKFQKNQEAARNALQKRQEMERAGMERQQQAEQRAMQVRQQQEQRSKQQRQTWARQEFDMKIALFRALPAANQAQLEKALKQSGLTLSDFGKNRLGPISNQWGSYFRKALVTHLRAAGASVASDNMWEEIGKQGGNAIVKGLGLGLGNMADFNHWVKTGEIRDSTKKKSSGSAASAGGDSQRRKIEKQLTRHGGGLIGDTGSNWRGGIPANAPMHSSEEMVRAQKGEFFVRKEHVAKNRSLLERINSGKEGLGAGTKPFNITQGAGPMALIGGGILKQTMSGMTRGIKERMGMEVQAKQAAEAAASMGAIGGGPGAVMSGPSGPVTALGKSAISWAQARMGYSGSTWINRCLSFVRQALGAPGLDQGAIDSWNQAQYKMRSTPPAGTPVFWSGGRYGHTALSLGGGRVISTDWPGAGTVSETTIGAITSGWNKPYMGWTRDINGKLVYPALKTGGEVRYDNTLANLHRGETVLTAPLTKHFKDSVANMGSGGDQISIDLRGAYIKEDVDIEKAVEKALQKRDSNRGRSRVVGNG